MDAAHYGRETKDKDMDNDFDIRQETLSSAEKEYENALRPLRFGDFSGQQKVVENLEVFVEAANRSTTRCCTDRQDWERRRSATSLPTNWEWDSR